MIFSEFSSATLFSNDNIQDLFRFNQFKNYPSKIELGWLSLLKEKIDFASKNQESFFYVFQNKGEFVLIIIRIPEWDLLNFGFQLSNIEIYATSETKHSTIKKGVREVNLFLKSKEVKFVSVRTNGDNLSVIHGLEDLGFRYFETVIWAITKSEVHKMESSNVRKAEKEDLERIKYIAENFQYQRGHYHCDSNFNLKNVNQLYKKWVESSFANNDHILLIEYDNEIAGYFVVKIDKMLEKHLGFLYGRLSSLALDESYRGKNLGKNLFSGALNYLRLQNTQYIDSGYSTKNHISAKLHNLNNMYSIYEEVTLHYWI